MVFRKHSVRRFFRTYLLIHELAYRCMPLKYPSASPNPHRLAMIVPRVTPINEPRDFQPHELFFSLTDDKGKIRYGNEVFTRISAYDAEELLDQPHNVIRHPDMPRCVFDLFWNYLKAGKSIAAYVKNLAKDGRYYWVLAVVVPCRGGYLSVRLKPSTALFDAAQRIYAETLAFEQKIEGKAGKKEAIEQATPFLLEKLAAAGFANYDDFMRAALAQELSARGEQLQLTPRPQGAIGNLRGAPSLYKLKDELSKIIEQLETVFSSLDAFQHLSDSLTAKQKVMEELGPSLSFLALNTNVSASRLGGEGAVLTVIARNLGDCSKEADQLIGTLMNRMKPLCDNARRLAYDVAVAQLEAQTIESFTDELITDGEALSDARVQESLEILTEELSRCCRSVIGGLHELLADVQVLVKAATDLVTQVEQMKIAQLNGKIEIASCRGAEGFHSIFKDVATIVDSARGDCDDIIEVLTNTGEEVQRLLQIEAPLDANLKSASRAVNETLNPKLEMAGV